MVNELEVDRAIDGLADPTRRAIVQTLARGPRTFSELADGFSIGRPAVSRHLRVLRRCGLVDERRVAGDGRKRLYALRPASLRPLDAWLDEVTGFWRDQLASFEEAAGELGRSSLQREDADGRITDR